MTAPLILPQHFDSTMRSVFVSCPQKFKLEFIHGFRPPGTSIDLHAGGCFAKAVEAVYRRVWVDGNDLETAKRRALAVFLMEWGDFEPPPHKRTAKTKDRTWEAIEEYFQKWPPHEDHIQPYFKADGEPTFEYTFAIPLEDPSFPLHPNGSPFVYCGRIDALGRYEGKPVVRDEKTSGASASTYWADKWTLRGQFMGYIWAMQQLGFDIDTVVTRGVGILKTKIDLQEAITPYTRDQIRNWYVQLGHDLHRLVKCWNDGYFDYNFGNACTDFGSCMFMDVCKSSHPESWYSNFQINHWNPLTGSTANEEAT